MTSSCSWAIGARAAHAIAMFALVLHGHRRASLHQRVATKGDHDAHQDPNVLTMTALIGLTTSPRLFSMGPTAPTLARSIPCLLYTSPSPRDRQKSRMPS